MLVFVDYEHSSGWSRTYGERVQAARTWITYRLEDLSGMPCHLVRYDRISQPLLDQLDAKAIFISGNSIDPAAYAPADLEPIHTILRETPLPVFGFCGGFQLVAQALGAKVVPLDPRPEVVEHHTVITMDDGAPFEFGYHPIDLSSASVSHPLLAGISDQAVFRHAHGLHVPSAPTGFEELASTAVTPIQMAAHTERKIVGTQFHPEYWTDEHSAGQRMISNFLSWAGVATS
jgi:GMP synthase (glutamine-hydrolysing)